MGWNDHLHPYEGDLAEVLSRLIEDDRLSGVQLAVARQVVDDSTLSLSAEQEKVLEAIERQHFVQECGRCGGEVPTPEQLSAMDSGLCGWCEHMMGKDD